MKKLLLLPIFLVILAACQENKQVEKNFLSGEALGTSYHITFFSPEKLDVEKGVDSVFYTINRSMSTYLPQSDISKINKGDTSIVVDHMFKEVLQLSKKINHKTKGYFDPTVGNLVNAYGFGGEKLTVKKDSATIDSLMNYVGLNKVSISSKGKLIKKNPGIYLEFNAIAKGYAVDRLGVYLENKGIKNYLVEVGGEIRTRGKNLKKDSAWQIGIDDPQQGKERRINSIAKLNNRALATSGNYRKFHVDSATGKKFVHIVNPKTGFPEKSDILSASVLAKNCATADAYATAIMAMGSTRAKAVLKDLPEIEAYLIFDYQGKTTTYITAGFKEVLVALKE